MQNGKTSQLLLKNVELNVEQLKIDFESEARTLFEAALELKKEFGVKGFPTLFFFDQAGNKEVVYGLKPYAFYEMGILKLDPPASKTEYNKNWETLFSKYSSLTAKEFSELSGTPRSESEKQLDELSGKRLLEKERSKNGAIWKFETSGPLSPE